MVSDPPAGGHGRWQLLAAAPASFRVALPDLPPLLADLLYQRLPEAARDPGAARAFLDPAVVVSGDPFLLPDMEPAVARLLRALHDDELIAIYGDYDVDGVSGTALLMEGLTALGARVVPHIPDRQQEGYGVNHRALTALRAQGATLAITVDTGITAIDEVAQARQRGLDVIITDHHLPGTIIPPAVAAINPRRSDSGYPYPQLAGVGVAYKLLQALAESRLGGLLRSSLASEASLELVALGTVADVAPLVGENRSLVRRGLRHLNATERLGLQALIDAAGLRAGQITAESIAWVIAPRLNAAGRLAHASRALRLLLSSEPGEAAFLAADLEAINKERQRLTRLMVEEARSAVDPAGEGVCWAGGPGFHPGVVGLAAARLAEEFGRPAVVLAIGEETATASLRSVPEFDLAAALKECAAAVAEPPLFLRYGGHRQAAGFTAPVDRLPEIRAKLGEVAQRELGHLPIGPRLVVDAEAAPQEWQGGAIKWLEALEPVGAGNPPPHFLARGLELLEARPLGNESEHLRLRLRNPQGAWSAIGFGLAARQAELTSRLDVVYYWTRDDFMGQPLLTLAVRDFAPSVAAYQGQLL